MDYFCGRYFTAPLVIANLSLRSTKNLKSDYETNENNEINEKIRVFRLFRHFCFFRNLSRLLSLNILVKTDI